MYSKYLNRYTRHGLKSHGEASSAMSPHTRRNLGRNTLEMGDTVREQQRTKEKR